jgi:hypothetical protein
MYMISAWQTLQEDDFGPHMEPAAVVVEESTGTTLSIID